MQWPLFEGVDQQQVDDLLQAARRRRFKRGETVFHEGDPADMLHLLDSGHVTVRVSTPYGETATLRVIGPGGLFGELAVVSPGPRNATVAAIEGCETLALHRDQLDYARRSSPAIERALLESVIQEVRRLSAAYLDAVYVPAPTRLARRLIDLADTYPASDDGTTTIPLTQDDLAGLCGTTRPTVNQMLGKLVELGLVELGRGRVVVKDYNGLADRAD